MYCKNCGTYIADSDVFCTECGNRIANSDVFCTECGNRMANDAQFCDNCGTPVAPKMPQSPNPAPTNGSDFFTASSSLNISESSQSSPSDALIYQPTPTPVSTQKPNTNFADPYEKNAVKHDNSTVPQQEITGNFGNKKHIFSSLSAKIIAGAVALILLLSAMFVTTRHTYKDPLYLTFEASLTGELGDILKLIPEDANKAMDEQLSDNDLDNLERTLESYYVWKGEQLTDSYGNNPKIKINVQNKVKLSEQELENENINIESRFGNAYSDADTKSAKKLREMQASKGYDLTIQARIKGSKQEKTNEYQVRVLLIGDNWYTTDFYYIVPAYLLA